MLRAMARVARPAFVLAWLATILASGAAVLAACGSFGVAEESPASEAGSEGAVREAGAALCEPGAFCDSFDDGKPLPRGWKAVATLGDASLTIVPDAGVGGSSALVATLVNDGKVQTALLPFEPSNACVAKGRPLTRSTFPFAAVVETRSWFSADGR